MKVEAMSRSFTVLDCEQRSPTWVAARLGRLCASRANDMLATVKSGESRARAKLRTQLVLERITGRSAEREYQSGAMRYGIETEATACAAYEALTGRLLEHVGFLSHVDLMAGCSLDGYFGDFEGIAEVKCPEPRTHLDYLKTGRVPKDYLDQVAHSLWLTGAHWCDWLSYCEEFPEELRAKLVRIPRASVDTAAYELAARLFLKEVDQETALVEAMRQKAVA